MKIPPVGADFIVSMRTEGLGDGGGRHDEANSRF